MSVSIRDGVTQEQGLGVRLEGIPRGLIVRRQWVTWKTIAKATGPAKVPFSIDGSPAKPNDPSTWNTFAAVRKQFLSGGFAGIGYMFSADDPFVGIDLDGCRCPAVGRVADWAREIIFKLASYAELSPSQTGVKLFIVGVLPDGKGISRKLPGTARISDKTPGIEVYDRGRYFALTGQRLKGCPSEPQARQPQLDALLAKYPPKFEPAPIRRAVGPTLARQPVIERARRYLAKTPPAVSGSFGHNATFAAACALVLGFDLSPDEAWQPFAEWNVRCAPPWSGRELRRKLDEADKKPGERGYLLRSVQLSTKLSSGGRS